MSNAVYLINQVDVRVAWKRIRHHLIPAIERSGGRWSPEYVLASLALGEQLLWTVVDEDGDCLGACTTQVYSYPEKSMVCIHYLGGENFDAWYQDILKAITDYAKNNGCDGIECNARAGFWKFFKKDGFVKTAVCYEKKT